MAVQPRTAVPLTHNHTLRCMLSLRSIHTHVIECCVIVERIAIDVSVLGSWCEACVRTEKWFSLGWLAAASGG